MSFYRSTICNLQKYVHLHKGDTYLAKLRLQSSNPQVVKSPCPKVGSIVFTDNENRVTDNGR